MSGELKQRAVELHPCWTCREKTFAEITHSSQQDGGQLYRCVNCKAVYPEQALSTRPSMDGVEDELRIIVNFLCGEGPLEGVWFGEDHPTRKGQFWWRRLLQQAYCNEHRPQALASLPLRSDGGGDPEETRRTALIYARNTMADIAQRNNAEDMVAKWKSGIFDSLPDISSRVDAFLAGVRHTQSAPPPVSDTYRDGVEDAAKIADEYAERTSRSPLIGWTVTNARHDTALKLAAAIRSLVVKPSGEVS